jgi:putative ABC transport system substrate-binding protein
MQFDQLKRREFITVLGGAAAWPLAAHAQQADVVRRIGVLSTLPANDPEGTARTTAFLQALDGLGWSDGRNLRVDIRWGAGDAERIRKYVAELIAFKPDFGVLACDGWWPVSILPAT